MARARASVVGLVSLLALIQSSSAAAQDRSEEAVVEEPRDMGLVERARRDLYQLDVTVRGPWDRIADLTRDDFELIVMTEAVAEFEVDSLCRAPTSKKTSARAGGGELNAVPARPPTTYLFYFDQAFLTMKGRNRGLQLARQLVPELIVGGNRGLVVSNGEVLATFADLTSDPEELLEGLAGIEKDPHQWDPTAVSEEQRIQDVLDAQSGRSGMPGSSPSKGSNTTRALKLARLYQMDEMWRTERALRRFSMVLGRLADIDPPKAVIYFADRVRSRPGEHYLAFFSSASREDHATARVMDMAAFSGMNASDRVIAEANAYGLRLYTVQAEGLTLLPNVAVGTTGNPASSTRTHLTSAEDTLTGLAMETGGRAFLHGIAAAKIARHIRGDLACVYLLSFDPGDFPRDRGLRVLLRVRRPGVEVQVRGQILIQSESARTTSRLFAAFAGPRIADAGVGLAGILIPTGFDGREFSALLQVVAGGVPVADAAWDLGASLVSRGKVREDVSRRVSVGGPGTRVVLESEVRLKPGAFEIVMVAHETTTDQIATGRLEGAWPNPSEDDGPVVGPIAIMQPQEAAFVRGEATRMRGSLGRALAEGVAADLPTALVSLVCRGRGRGRTLRLTRRLVGEESVDFDEVLLEPNDDQCTQVRDLIPPHLMTEGGFVYEIAVFEADEQVAFGSREFVTVEDPKFP